MSEEPRPIRRVVTGNDAQGRSCVLYDSDAPNVNPGAISRGTCMTDIWVGAIRLVVAGPPDGGMDRLARVLADRLSDIWSQPGLGDRIAALPPILSGGEKQ